ncbi:hypothetical protein BDU57DRAFT_533813 [Ampelomyces quisqualis]|uniref:Uncharacterized protein n=1 Tax=Ampelomyces quisqualis TaxID=50730 RepID=A0A6A5Q870_AMPQU|nr:hypothetical protein BDU57DRAFT_533813 [Ampelomyces quisqualis]
MLVQIRHGHTKRVKDESEGKHIDLARDEDKKGVSGENTEGVGRNNKGDTDKDEEQDRGKAKKTPTRNEVDSSCKARDFRKATAQHMTPAKKGKTTYRGGWYTNLTLKIATPNTRRNVADATVHKERKQPKKYALLKRN